MQHEFFQVVSLEQALEHRARFAPVGAERLRLSEVASRVLAEPVVATEDVPDFRRATMDGYAVQGASTFGASDGSPALLQIVGTVAMGRPTELEVGPGQAARIATGGMLPTGADAVIMVEHTEALDAERIETYRTVAPGQHLIGRGDDVRAGEVLLERGVRLGPQQVGLLAALGRVEVPVYRQPVVSIISTGDEVVAVDAEPGPGQVRDVNSYSLAAAVREAGAVPCLEGIVPDDFEALRTAAEQALDRTDLVLLSGGSSVGVRDFTVEVIRALPAAELLVHGISIKPGKPTILAQVAGKAFFGLPGHVASALVVFRTVVRPFVEQLAGCAAPRDGSRAVPARLGRSVPSVHGRTDFVRVRLEGRDGELVAHPVLGPSGLLRTMVLADGLVRIDRDAEGLDEGAEVAVLPW